MSSIELLPIFPYPIIEINTNPEFIEIKNDLIEYIYKENENDPKGLKQSNEGGWHSNYNIHKKNNFEKYYEFIMKNINQSIGIYFKSGVIFTMKDCWANINSKGDENKLHCHPNNDISGCFWIKSPDTSSCLSYLNSEHFAHDKLLNSLNEDIKQKYFISSELTTTPTEGYIALFPSNLMHRVLKNNSDEHRISIAFNIQFNN